LFDGRSSTFRINCTQAADSPGSSGCFSFWWYYRENIAYGKPGATDSEIVEAAQKANALEFIERFPEKLEQLWVSVVRSFQEDSVSGLPLHRAVLKDPES
jgi:ABC-type transport system involved in Fe-S cluster assembly fused permease/ATPase subunit